MNFSGICAAFSISLSIPSFLAFSKYNFTASLRLCKASSGESPQEEISNSE